MFEFQPRISSGFRSFTKQLLLSSFPMQLILTSFSTRLLLSTVSLCTCFFPQFLHVNTFSHSFSTQLLVSTVSTRNFFFPQFLHTAESIHSFSMQLILPTVSSCNIFVQFLQATASSQFLHANVSFHSFSSPSFTACYHSIPHSLRVTQTTKNSLLNNSAIKSDASYLMTLSTLNFIQR